MEFGDCAAAQDIHSHLAGVGAKLGVIDAAGGEGAGGNEGICAGVVGDARIVEDLSHGARHVHHHVVGGGEDGVTAAHQGVGGGDHFVSGVAGLFEIFDAQLLQICLGLGDGGLGVDLGVGVQQAHAGNVGISRQHHVDDEAGVQGVGSAGDGIHAGQACGFGIGAGGVDDGDVVAVGGGDHALGGQGGDGDDGVKIVGDHLGADLIQDSGVVLAVEDLELDGSGGELCFDGSTDLVERGVIQLLDDGDPGDAVIGGGAAGGEDGQGHHGGENDAHKLFHRKTSIKKVLTPLTGSKDRKYKTCGTTLLAGNPAAFHGANTPPTR